MPPAKRRAGASTAKRSRPQPKVAQLRVTLLETTPLVWRRVLVAYDTPLSTLHRVLLTVMGWQGYHLHQFTMGDVRYGILDDEFADQLSYEIRPDDATTLRQTVPIVGTVFTYEYDFGDGWTHEVELERLRPLGRLTRVPYCLDGARACPPEDVGGTHGYAEMLSVLAGSDDKDELDRPDDVDPPEGTRASYRRWLGYDFDPDEFHPRCVNMELFRLTATDEQFWPLLPE